MAAPARFNRQETAGRAGNRDAGKRFRIGAASPIISSIVGSGAGAV